MKIKTRALEEDDNWQHMSNYCFLGQSTNCPNSSSILTNKNTNEKRNVRVQCIAMNIDVHLSVLEDYLRIRVANILICILDLPRWNLLLDAFIF